VLDVDALAKGWIIEEAATILRLVSDDFFVNAGGDVLARGGERAEPWRVGVQHPSEPAAVLGVFELTSGAVATSGTYERGDHIRATAARLPGEQVVSVTVVGPDLGEADALSTAAYAAGVPLPAWWADVDPAYGLLVMTGAGRLRWCPPAAGSDVRWHFPS
jgi:thiamine biosynthesis lipoprotein